MATLSWYWHRLRAMSPLEVGLHARKKLRERADARWSLGAVEPHELNLGNPTAFPELPPPERAPLSLQAALRQDAAALLAGHWKLFERLDLRVDDPPQWQRDYLVGRNLATQESAFGLNHRALPHGADIRVVWECNRWHQLTRLAMAAYVLGDPLPAGKCVAWLQDWVKQNPPYCGWNWTSALEVGLRLVQFTWIDALLKESRHADQAGPALESLRVQILPAHVHYAWRHRSFGSSANNHLLGELAGLILATVRWPSLTRWGTSLRELQWLWEREVLKQFADDGGNREQALGYQLFAWELCWQTRNALRRHGAMLEPNVEDRLRRALCFFWEVQSRTEHWDYGDSDNGSTTPFGLSEATRVREWRSWAAEDRTCVLDYWLGAVSTTLNVAMNETKRGAPANTRPVAGWWIYEQSGMALNESGFWWLRWDLSPLGYLRTAAHGHLDVLHLSVWYHGVPLVVDPGTGAYFADPALRTWLASREAHNGPAPSPSRGPCPIPCRTPRRLGPFLWSDPHGPASYLQTGGFSLQARALGYFRRITRVTDPEGWEIEDGPTEPRTRRVPFVVRWQFAPGTWIKCISDRKYSVHRADVSVMIEVDETWETVELLELSEAQGSTGAGQTVRGPLDKLGAGSLDRLGAGSLDKLGASPYDGVVSPGFRQVLRGPCLKLTALPRRGQPCVFRTRFLASPAT